MSINSHIPPFGITNYIRMYKSKGFKLPIYYFFQVHLFDLIHRVDTHKWLPKEYGKENKAYNSNHNHIYMASWTCEIKNVFNRLNQILGKGFEDYTFIDIGCGKGKVGIIWTKCCLKLGITQKIIGIDINQELIDIANNNYQKIFNKIGNYYLTDAKKFNPKQHGGKFILYMYNPFDDVILSKMLDNFSPFEVLIAYNNPTHIDIFIKKGFKKIFENSGFHGNLNTIGFLKSN